MAKMKSSGKILLLDVVERRYVDVGSAYKVEKTRFESGDKHKLKGSHFLATISRISEEHRSYERIGAYELYGYGRNNGKVLSDIRQRQGQQNAP